MRRVADASAIAAIKFNEDEAGEAAAGLGDAELFAPGLIVYELTSIALKKVRREDQALDATLARLATLDDFAIDLSPVDPVEVAALAAATGLSAYDASYLWLAHALDAPLVTLDRKLALAASSTAAGQTPA